MSKTVLFQIKQVSISNGELHSPKPQHYWNLPIRLFSVIQDTHGGGVLPLCRGAIGVLYSPSRLDNIIYIYIYTSVRMAKC